MPTCNLLKKHYIYIYFHFSEIIKFLLILHQILSACLQHTHRHKPPLYKPTLLISSHQIISPPTTHFKLHRRQSDLKLLVISKFQNPIASPHSQARSVQTKLLHPLASISSPLSPRPYLLTPYSLASLTLSHFRILMLRHPPHLRLRFAPFVTTINRHRVPSQNYPLGVPPRSFSAQAASFAYIIINILLFYLLQVYLNRQNGLKATKKRLARQIRASRFIF